MTRGRCPRPRDQGPRAGVRVLKEGRKEGRKATQDRTVQSRFQNPESAESVVTPCACVHVYTVHSTVLYCMIDGGDISDGTSTAYRPCQQISNNSTEYIHT
jgi:hypothetical protein